MSKRRFTKEEIEGLSKNIYIKRCSEKSITYANEFKLLAIQRYFEEGLAPSQIFYEAGFDPNIIGKETASFNLKAWRRVRANKGIFRLSEETRGRAKGGGRPKTKGITDADRIRRMEIKIAYLEAENAFLIKLRAAKRKE
jgi:transposase-like protein